MHTSHFIQRNRLPGALGAASFACTAKQAVRTIIG
ncbi:hypothetical protein XVE_0689 [Xanthomonas vesicatoria ATCC 35937]|uniref:Uncharacterized protein n=1 Tax=Xanthomonas vesicatoria ATCC 35937 TaxID=925775 RepID=F0B9D7_9XANT|nr:hypothetical protein XVE_0689 [Xanthomonas vesicatoria ATCC 35937]